MSVQRPPRRAVQSAYDLTELRRRLRDRLDDLVGHLYPEARRNAHEWRIGGARGGAGESCSIDRREGKAGLWVDHNPVAAHRSGDVIDLIAIKKGATLREAIEWSARFVNLEPLRSVSPRATAGVENLARLKSNLRRSPRAMDYLRGRGLTDATIERYHLGIREPYPRKKDGAIVSNALCYPIINRDGRPMGRYGAYNIPGLTANPVSDNGWGAGSPVTYWSGDTHDKRVLFVAEGCKDLWILAQHTQDSAFSETLAIISSSHGSDVPGEWHDPDFWGPWDAVYFGHDTGDAGEEIARALARCCARDVRRVRVPECFGKDWTDFFMAGGSVELLRSLMAEAPAVSEPPPRGDAGGETVGDFAALPININGAYENGHLYYPFTVEHREVERLEGKDGLVLEQPVACYKTKVIRSDGAVLDVVLLPAPRGTPYERRVLALTDGTRIEREPQPSHHATWHLDSIKAYINAMQGGRRAPHRPLGLLLGEVEEHFRRSVWLPYEEDYVILTLYVALSYVYQIFPAIPLIIVSGDKGTGKSELGYAIASISFNGFILGQGSAASVVRMLNESRGLVVLDDLEALGRTLERDFSDVNQMLKLSYKKQTGKKALTGTNGRTVMYDFYGPKVITNTQGVDAILGSRMLYIQSRRMPGAVHNSRRITGSDPGELFSLRNELHTWGMGSAAAVDRSYKLVAAERTDRDDEIAAPLRALAELSGDRRLSAGLEAALNRQPARRLNIDDPVELLKEAANNCIRAGALKQLSSIQLNLELRLIAENVGKDWTNLIPQWQQGEWIGHQLRALEIRDIHEKVSRARLYGNVTRIYTLREGYVREVLDSLKADGVESAEPRHPFDFCEQTACEACPYAGVCSATVSALMPAKQMNRGKSGRRQMPGR